MVDPDAAPLSDDEEIDELGESDDEDEDDDESDEDEESEDDDTERDHSSDGDGVSVTASNPFTSDSGHVLVSAMPF